MSVGFSQVSRCIWGGPGEDGALRLRFFFQPVLLALSFLWFTLGGVWMFAGPLVIYGITAIVDAAYGDYSAEDDGGPLADLPLHIAWLLLVGLVVYFVSLVSVSFPGWRGILGSSGILPGAVHPQPWWALAGGIVCLGMHISAVAGIVGHEFAHRTSRPGLLSISQWLSALALHTSFPIEHVIGHHRNVGTDCDPTTAWRGEGFWRYIFRSVAGSYRNAWRFESARCRRHGLSMLHNRALAGLAKQALVLAAVYTLAGIAGLAAFLAAGLIAMIIIEQFNYVAHYGLVRVPGERVRPEHSWNWSLLGSTSYMFNLTRHSGHHLSAAKRYWQLPGSATGPVYPLGPFPMVMIALVPPLFRHLTKAELARWDRTFATEAERTIVERKGHAPNFDTHANWLRA